MYLVAQEVQRSIFYGYANSEVLFDESIVDTLEALHPAMQFFPRHLIVGRKTNLKLVSILVIISHSLFELKRMKQTLFLLYSI